MKISARGRAYKSIVGGLCVDQGVYGLGLSGLLRLDIKAGPPDRRRRDLDNLSKSLFDSLQGAGVFIDDNQIDDFRMRRDREIKKGTVLVTIYVLGE